MSDPGLLDVPGRLQKPAGPLFTIITATYNAASHLPALAASLDAQTCGNYEWLVIDGDSRDGTKEILKTLGNPRLRWLSEPDRGIYDAMNKGLDQALGSYIYFIGADDCLAANDVLAKIAAIIESNVVDLVCGVVDTGHRARFVSNIGIKTLVLNSVHHQGAFYRRERFLGFRYRIDVPVVADYELNLLARLQDWRFVATDILVAVCGMQGVSNTTGMAVLYEQLHRLRSRHIGALRSRLYWAIGMANVVRRGVQPRDR